ncbi:MAG: BamA/TamA family outer membrane protein [Candidatus Protochlamydia sp.]|nr:BamA/TamA family outer membrane protein [Candidatus Protochlamydia sp.]
MQTTYKIFTLKLTKAVYIIAALFFTFPCFSYEIYYEGLQDKTAHALLESVSQLVKLKDTPPPTLLGLKKRADGDIPNLVLALQSLSYYEAKVTFEIADNGTVVLLKINTGPAYPLKSFSVRYFQEGNETLEEPTSPPSLKCLNVELGALALPETIISAEDTLLDKLHLEGYAFASIIKKDVFADKQEKVVIVMIEVELGPQAFFGPVKIKGLERVRKSYFYKKFRWEEGDLYDPKKIEKTHEALELSGLFSSVNLAQGEREKGSPLFPLDINVVEAKQRTIGFGANFISGIKSGLGPGITAEWQDRNIGGEGESLSFQINLWKKQKESRITYLIPDFCRQNQNLIWQLDYKKEQIKAFRESAFSLSATIDRQISDKLRVSYGAMYKLLRSTKSARDGTYDLFKVPLQLQWTAVDSLLDPTTGWSAHLKVTPSLQVLRPYFAYSINSLTTSFYQPLTQDKRHVFAGKLMLGTITGARKHDIPPPERFLAGSENALRGYGYLTVSPLGKDCKILGGRSLLIYSLELRSRIGKNFGLVGFYEIGNVFPNFYPDFNKKFLQSAGFGIRYHTPVGPLRVDFAVPLNRRNKKLDHPFEIYFSIGQAF